MMAKQLAIVMKQVGLLDKGHLVEVQRSDLVAGHIGQTGKRTSEKIEEAKGGVLFVDEAYTLVGRGERDFGTEAVEELMRHMNGDGGGDPVFIFAGYEDKMSEFMHANAGLYRRISKQFFFVDYSPEELAQMVRLKVNEKKFKYAEGGAAGERFLDALLRGAKFGGGQLFKSMAHEMNGGVAQQLVEGAKEHLDSRLDETCLAHAESEELESALLTFNDADFEAAAKEMVKKWQAKEGADAKREGK